MSTSGDPHLLRTTFEQVAELYDRARPRYPTSVFDDLVALARLREGARIVEIGCGTGQATLPLAQRGLEIVCVELGGRLAAVARRKLASFAAVEIVTSSFEAWEPDTADFDAVVAFTAFHWLDPEVRCRRPERREPSSAAPRRGRRSQRRDRGERPLPHPRRPPPSLGRPLRGRRLRRLARHHLLAPLAPGGDAAAALRAHPAADRGAPRRRGAADVPGDPRRRGTSVGRLRPFCGC